MLFLLQKLGTLDVRLEDTVEDSGVVATNFLLHMEHRDLLGVGELAVGNVPQQCGLPAPVAPDKTVLAPVVDVQLRVLEKDELPVGDAQVLRVDVAAEGGVLTALPGAGVVDLAAEEGRVRKTFLLTLAGGTSGVFGGLLLEALTTLLFVLLESFLVNVCGLSIVNITNVCEK